VHMQLVKCCLLQNSNDPVVRDVYKIKEDRVTSHAARGRARKHCRSCSRSRSTTSGSRGRKVRPGLELAGPLVTSGLRRRRICGRRSQKRWSLCAREKHMQHAARLPLQGVWLSWPDSARPFDLSWQNLITTPPSLIKFVLNAQINCVRTPDMLKLWGYTDSATCPLCSAVQCTLHHILVDCKFALNQKRYTWRHDSVLKNIEVSLAALVADFNRRKPKTLLKATRETFNACFVRKGETKKRGSQPPERFTQSVLECANDWRLSVDFDAKKASFHRRLLQLP
jgi:hypothetical protein